MSPFVKNVPLVNVGPKKSNNNARILSRCTDSKLTFYSINFFKNNKNSF